MILNRLLEDMVWDDTMVLPEEAEALKFFRFMHTAIADNQLYVSKAIGFSLSVPGLHPRTSTYIARHLELGDSYPELMASLQNKIFLTTESQVTIALEPGINTLENTSVMMSRSPITCRYTDPYVCRSLQKQCSLKLLLSLNNGSIDMQQSSAEVGNKYFPIYSYFYLGDFVRILPPAPGSNVVKLRYYNGFTSTDLRTILEVNYNLYLRHNMKEETRKWILSFGQ